MILIYLMYLFSLETSAAFALFNLHFVKSNCSELHVAMSKIFYYYLHLPLYVKSQ